MCKKTLVLFVYTYITIVSSGPRTNAQYIAYKLRSHWRVVTRNGQELKLLYVCMWSILQLLQFWFKTNLLLIENRATQYGLSTDLNSHAFHYSEFNKSCIAGQECSDNICVTMLFFALHILFQCSILHRVLATDASSFEASTSVSVYIPLLLSKANQTIAQNLSQYASTPFPIGIGETTAISIYSNWPVPVQPCVAEFRMQFSLFQA